VGRTWGSGLEWVGENDKYQRKAVRTPERTSQAEQPHTIIQGEIRASASLASTLSGLDELGLGRASWGAGELESLSVWGGRWRLFLRILEVNIAWKVEMKAITTRLRILIWHSREEQPQPQPRQPSEAAALGIVHFPFAD
jgi:hypothetical protein